MLPPKEGNKPPNRIRQRPVPFGPGFIVSKGANIVKYNDRKHGKSPEISKCSTDGALNIRGILTPVCELAQNDSSTGGNKSHTVTLDFRRRRGIMVIEKGAANRRLAP